MKQEANEPISGCARWDKSEARSSGRKGMEDGDGDGAVRDAMSNV